MPRHLTREVDERLLSSGEVHAPLDRAGIAQACRALAAEGVEAVAVCFLHSYANPEHERIAGEMIREAMPDVYLVAVARDPARISRVRADVDHGGERLYRPEGRRLCEEPERRAWATSAFAAHLSIMRSNGGVMTPEVATERPAAMMESGPVGGIIASAQVGLALGFANVISFDMGGTTAKASLIRDGEPTLAPGYYVGGYASGHPVMLPMIDVVEVGAGGGCIAWRRRHRRAQSRAAERGRRSRPDLLPRRRHRADHHRRQCGARPARSGQFPRRQMKLDAEGARRGIKDKVADPLKLDPIVAAQAIVDISINKMSLAVREVSVAKGYDPRDFALVASGGAGPLHVCAIARELYIPTVIVPLFPSHFSALGMLLADERHDFIRTVYSDLARSSSQARGGASTRWWRTPIAPAPRQETPSIKSISIFAMSARSSRCRFRSRGSAQARRSRRHPGRIRPAL